MSGSGLLDRIVYAIASAAIRAWFDELKKQREVFLEEVTDEDLVRSDNFRRAVQRVREEGDNGAGAPDPSYDHA